MKRFFGRIGRFFWSWGFLKFVLWTATIIVLFYVEEDWRGARAWAATKAKWEAKGETFDYAKFIPPPVPDSENLAALPLFQYTQVRKNPGAWEPVVLEHALSKGAAMPLDDLPHTNWMKGEMPDMNKKRADVATSYEKVFKGAPMPADSLAQFDAVFPFVGELRAASATRPFCRFPHELVFPPAESPMGLLSEQILVAKILTLHALLALDEHQSDLALEDLKLIQKLSSGVARDPSLVAGLISIGMNSISGTAIYFGLAHHDWSDTQLAELEHMRGDVDFLAGCQFAYRAEAAEYAEDIDYYRHVKRPSLYEVFMPAKEPQNGVTLADVIWPWPDGWWDTNKLLMADYLLTLPTIVDPQARRVFPERAKELSQKVDEDRMRWDWIAPWRMLYTVAAPPFVNAAKQFAAPQALADMTRIACALERYRLAHGNYPPTLAELAPGYIDAMPHDIVNGDPYRYRLKADGTFTLYSVGWNQVDDGGKIVQNNVSKSIDYEQGDWVWPTPKEAKP